MTPQPSDKVRRAIAVVELMDAGRELADYVHGPYAECGCCGLSHAHTPECLIARWLVAGGQTRFSVEDPASDK